MKGKVAALDLDRPSAYGEEQSVAAGPACETLRGTKPTMPIELKMPALSPTMEEGTLAKWLVKEGDTVQSGDLLAEIETDKATMEYEAIDDGVISQILVPEGSENVKVGTVIAVIAGEGEDASAAKAAPAPAAAAPAPNPEPVRAEPVEAPSSSSAIAAKKDSPSTSSGQTEAGERIKASPLAKRIAAEKGIDLSTITGTGPGGRIVKDDLEGVPASAPAAAAPAPAATAAPAAAPAPAAVGPIPDFGIPHEDEKLSGMRKTIARRLTQSMQEAPHIYLTVDIRLDALLKLRGELNASLESRGVKLSVNDMLIKALAVALERVPACNVSFGGDVMRKYSRADISVAVSIPGGLITPIITDAGGKSMSKISTEMSELAAKAKEGKLQPNEYQGGTASISNMGMMGIKQFTAVINPPQAMIMAIGAGEKRPYVVDDALAIATVMSATGSFDHRAIDGADGALLMKTFKELVESPLGLVA
jgi:pyruvate dehydrogenase E2 component (dihydrolipoamide acetyltransferase)